MFILSSKKEHTIVVLAKDKEFLRAIAALDGLSLENAVLLARLVLTASEYKQFIGQRKMPARLLQRAIEESEKYEALAGIHTNPHGGKSEDMHARLDHNRDQFCKLFPHFMNALFNIKEVGLHCLCAPWRPRLTRPYCPGAPRSIAARLAWLRSRRARPSSRTSPTRRSSRRWTMWRMPSRTQGPTQGGR
ncbi:hypothetical protein M885DRAFT_506708 [Pelagophyceae sp. CCMP2097]|nr:hypothetical protein M885DRAFT_506708 [Pelagophyceae sp. CCMP2097]